MADNLDDPLWPHFQPLWADLQNTQRDQIFIAGGYGLFLKQIWVLQTDTPIVIPLDQWSDATPRVTKDVDLVLSVDLIANQQIHNLILEVLNRHDFFVTEKLEGKRWQFEKSLGDDRKVVLELHAPQPSKGRSNVQADRIRVKHKPSLGDAGVHGRTNPEAEGSELCPTLMDLNGQSFSIINPVTLSVMKLTAMRDRWETSQDQSRHQEMREFSQAQAAKHAQDVCRVIAMVTVEERDSAQAIVDALREGLPFQTAAKIVDTHFRNETNPAALVARNKWRQEDISQIDAILDSWFK